MSDKVKYSLDEHWLVWHCINMSDEIKTMLDELAQLGGEAKAEAERLAVELEKAEAALAACIARHGEIPS